MLAAYFPKDCILEVFASKSAACDFPSKTTYVIPERLKRRRKEKQPTTTTKQTNKTQTKNWALGKVWSNPQILDMRFFCS